MTQYLDLDAALDRAKERTQRQATTADDDWLTELLQMSAGVAGGVTHYRPYYCAAKLLEQKLASQTISEADGAKFTGLAKPIASLLGLQAAYDSSNGLTVPVGFEASPANQGPQRLRSRTLARIPTP